MARRPPANTPIPNALVQHSENPSRLLLDAENPRLIVKGMSSRPNQDELLKTMWSFGCQDIAVSIATSGYQNIEPLFVVETSEGRVVVEGNRRLTALQVLLDPARAARLDIKGVPELPPEHRAGCENVNILIGTKEQVWAFIGTKHLNGPKLWDSEAKAHFVTQVHESQGISLEAIANTIGDSNATVRRLYMGYSVLRQAERNDWYHRDDHLHPSGEFPFSHLYTLVGHTHAQNYLGIKAGINPREPVPPEKADEARKVLRWLFGHAGDRIAPVVRQQNPDLRFLNMALSNRLGVETLERTKDVRMASEAAEGAEVIVLRHLTKAQADIGEATSRLALAIKGERKEEIRDCVQNLFEQAKGMRAVVRSADDDD